MISEAEADHPADPVFYVSVPIISRESDQVVGVMVNHIFGSELNKVLSGRRQIELGAQERHFDFHKTLELYLVNRDGLMITPSRFISDVILKQKVETKLTRACLEDGQELAGRYQN